MNYLYSGPPSGVSLNTGGDRPREILLFPGQKVELEPDNDYTLALLAEGYLQTLPAAGENQPASATPSRGKGGSK